MKKRILILLIVPVLGAIACQREIVEQFPKPTDVVNPNPPVPPTEYKYGLAELGAKVGLKVGTAVTRDEYFKNDSVEVILKRDFAAATMGNEMKHSSIVQANGNLNFKTADELYGWINSCGNAVYGHTLGWHQQQNTAYLNGLVEKADDENASSLLRDNWRFESGSLEPFGGTVTITSAPRETFAGNYSVKAASEGATLITPAVNSDAEAYALSFWAKGTGDVKVDISDGKTATVTLEEGWKKYTVSEKVKDGTDYTYTITLPEGTVVDNVRVCQTTIEEEEETKDNYINPYTLVEGGDFETFELGAVGQNNWGVYNGGDYMSIVDNPTHSGARAMKLDNSTGVAANAWDIQVAAPTVNVEVGKTYRIAWYIKASAEADIQIDVRGYTSGTQYFSSQYSQFTKPNEEWQYSFLDVTPDENGDGTLTVVFYGGTAPVTYYIDDFQIFEAVKEGDYTNYINKDNLLTGADFEGQYDWGVWNGGEYASVVNRNIVVDAEGVQTQNIGVNSDKVHSALQALVVDNSAGTWTGGDAWHIQVANNNKAPVTAGDEYRLGFWAKSPDGYSTIQAELKWDSGTTNYIQIPGITSDWSFIYVDVTAPADAAEVQIVLDCAYSAGTLYLDDCQLYPKPVEGFIDPADIVGNGDFETFELGAVGQNNWGVYNGGDYMSIVDNPTHSGARAMKLDNSTGVAANAWDIQVAAPTVNVEVGKTYRIAWYIKASAEADIQIDVRGYTSGTQYFSSQYSQFTKPNEEWQYSFLDVTPDENGDGTLTVVFYGGTAPVTYYIDDFQIFPVEAAEAVKAASRGYGKYADINYVRPAAGSGHVRLATVESGTKFDGETVYDCLDFAYKKFVYGMIEHYDVYGWDVMNEVFTDNGVWRSGENTTGDNIFIWGDYLGGSKAFTERAFAYAKDALDLYGMSADLYINDYNLEYSSSKLNSICAFVKDNPNVDGIGSQMHIQSTTDLEKIKDMLEAMVATGKLVRISELDITFDSNAGGIEQDQIDRYVYIFDQYLTLVPEAQRGGISIWGINDKDSWLGEDKAPLLYKGKKYERKPAYEALYKYLLEKAGME